MKIAVIGEGIIGNFVSQYLSKKGHKVECISPEIKVSKKDHNRDNEKFFADSNKLKSPKLNKNELLQYKSETEKIFLKESSEFYSLELGCEMGLSRYWGANLAYEALKDDLKNLKLNDEEISFIDEMIPFLNVQSYYKKFNYKNYNYKDIRNLKSSVVAIYENKLKKNSFLGFDNSEAIFGNRKINKYKYSKIDGIVLKIEFENSNPRLLIKESNLIYKKNYDFVLLSSGALGSYRLVMNSFNLNKNIFNYMDKLNHHPLLTSICFLPKVPYPENYIGISNMDAKFKIENINIFINFIPLESALRIFKANFLKNVKINFLKIWFKKISNFLKLFSEFLIIPIWILRRLYVANIYLPSELSASFIGCKDNKISIIGGLRSDFKKLILIKLWNNLLKVSFFKGIYFLFVKPLKVSLGADLHYASSLSQYTNPQAKLKDHKNKSKLIIVDSSSSSYLPTANPTLYFLARSIRLLRDL